MRSGKREWCEKALMKCSELLRTSLGVEGTPSLWKSDGNLHHLMLSRFVVWYWSVLKGGKLLLMVKTSLMMHCTKPRQGGRGWRARAPADREAATRSPELRAGAHWASSSVSQGPQLGQPHICPSDHWPTEVKNLLELPFARGQAGKKPQLLLYSCSVPQPQDATMANPAYP